MDYNIINQKKLSKMTLGTVQLGLNYGIANTLGQPDESKAHSMLEAAVENGITSFDTARGYGTSEDVLGRFFNKLSKKDDLFITSKLVVNLPEGATKAQVEVSMLSSVETSLSKLGVSKLDCLMLHRGEDVTKYGSYVPEVMEKLISMGYIDMAGVSVYSSEELDNMMKYNVFTATQVPMSIFDQQLIYKGYINKLKEKNISVFVRSVFLQGLFFMNPNEFTDPILIEYVKPYLIKLNDICSQTGMSIAELAISFIRDIPGVTSLVLGADTPKQVSDNITCLNAPVLPGSVRQEISELFKNVNMEKIMEVLRRPKNN